MAKYLSDMVLLFIILGIFTNSNVARHHHRKSQHSSTTDYPLETTDHPLATTVRTSFPSLASELSTTEAITLKFGNRTINTNLQNALDDIAPSKTNQNTEQNSLVKNNEENSNQSNSTSNVFFEVIHIDPIFKFRNHKYNVKFIIVTSLYATLGLACILITYCFVRIVVAKKKRHRQYMLLTKRDMDFPLGGGGI